MGDPFSPLHNRPGESGLRRFPFLSDRLSSRTHRRIKERPLINTGVSLVLIVRDTDPHRTGACPAPAIICREGNMVDTAITWDLGISSPLSSHFCCGCPNTSGIWTGFTAAGPSFEHRFILTLLR